MLFPDFLLYCFLLFSAPVQDPLHCFPQLFTSSSPRLQTDAMLGWILQLRIPLLLHALHLPQPHEPQIQSPSPTFRPRRIFPLTSPRPGTRPSYRGIPSVCCVI